MKKDLIIYDASCGVCSSAAQKWEAVLDKYGFDLVPAQEIEVGQFKNLTNEEPLNDILLFTLQGEKVVGANVYRKIFQRISYLKPIYFASKLPLLRNLFDIFYRIFAERRHKVSRVCGLKGLAKG